MARALLVVSRRGDGPGAAGQGLEAGLRALDRRLCPDNIDARPLIVRHEAGATAVVFNPNPSIRVHGASICLGATIGAESDWPRPGASRPDGSYALFRCDERSVELVADAVASRTVWYVRTADAFIASTSQRAIVCLLGRFEPNADVVPWMLSSGTLGPGRGWDARLDALRPRERVWLDRETWDVSTTRERACFRPRPDFRPDRQRARLESVVGDVCRRIDLDPSRWLLPLSGGVDSRGLLLFLRERGALETITWGLGAAQNDAGNDPAIAKRIAGHVGASHRYFPTDASDEPHERLIDRFLSAGEGRVAKISGYTDGFRVWKTLHEENWDGVIRGDQAFGTMAARTEYEARFAGGLTLLSDYFDPAAVATFGLSPQSVPDQLARRNDETLTTWRDRIYHEFRLPRLLAALTDLKTPYVEVVSPLLVYSVLALAREVPDRFRTRKRLWRELVRSKSAGIPFARRVAVQQLGDFLRDPIMLELMLGELESPTAGDQLGPALRSRVCADLKSVLSAREAGGGPFSWRSRAAALLPAAARSRARRLVATQPVLNPLVLAFRAFVVARMTRLLVADSTALTTRYRDAANL